MPGIFISYRREDSIAYAGRIYDRLLTHFDRSGIFMDIDTIEPGVDFVQVVERAVISCDVLLAVIGKQWLTMADRDGNRRLDHPGDFVRLEIATALARNIRVIPMLVGGAAMPQSVDLPEDLAMLARRHGMEVPDVGFHGALSRLIESVEKQRAAAREQQRVQAESESRRQALAEQVNLAQQQALAERQAQALAQQQARARQEIAERQRQDWLARQQALAGTPPPPAPLMIPERKGWAKWLLIYPPSGWAGWLVHVLFFGFLGFWIFLTVEGLASGMDGPPGPAITAFILVMYAVPVIVTNRIALYLDRKARKRNAPRP